MHYGVASQTQIKPSPELDSDLNGEYLLKAAVSPGPGFICVRETAPSALNYNLLNQPNPRSHSFPSLALCPLIFADLKKPINNVAGAPKLLVT